MWGPKGANEMTKATKIEQGRTWLRLVRGEGDAETKRAYLGEKGFTEEELKELLEWDAKDREGTPLFG